MSQLEKFPNRRKARFTMEQAHAIRSLAMGTLYVAAGLFILYFDNALGFVKGNSRIGLVVLLAVYGVFRLYRGISEVNFINRRLK